jgi:hypothetical protein
MLGLVSLSLALSLIMFVYGVAIFVSEYQEYFPFPFKVPEISSDRVDSLEVPVEIVRSRLLHAVNVATAAVSRSL